MKNIFTALLLCFAFLFLAENTPAQPLSWRLDNTVLNDAFSVRRGGFRMPKTPARKAIPAQQSQKQNAQKSQATNKRGGFLSGLVIGSLLASFFGFGGGFGWIFVLLALVGVWLFFKNKANTQK